MPTRTSLLAGAAALALSTAGLAGVAAAGGDEDRPDVPPVSLAERFASGVAAVEGAPSALDDVRERLPEVFAAADDEATVSTEELADELAEGADEDGDALDADVDGPEGTHGAAVSEVARSTEPGPEHGPTVAEVARSNGGRDDDAEPEASAEDRRPSTEDTADDEAEDTTTDDAEVEEREAEETESES